jgi:hypothetical protein
MSSDLTWEFEWRTQRRRGPSLALGITALCPRTPKTVMSRLFPRAALDSRNGLQAVVFLSRRLGKPLLVDSNSDQISQDLANMTDGH